MPFALPVSAIAHVQCDFMANPPSESDRRQPVGRNFWLDASLWLAWLAFAYAVRSAIYGRSAPLLVDIANALGAIIVYFTAGAILYVITLGPRRRSRAYMFACFFIGAAALGFLQYYGRQP